MKAKAIKKQKSYAAPHKVFKRIQIVNGYSYRDLDFSQYLLAAAEKES